MSPRRQWTCERRQQQKSHLPRSTRRDFGKSAGHLAFVEGFGCVRHRSLASWFLDNLCGLWGSRACERIRVQKANRTFEPNVEEVAQISVRDSNHSKEDR